MANPIKDCLQLLSISLAMIMSIRNRVFQPAKSKSKAMCVFPTPVRAKNNAIWGSSIHSIFLVHGRIEHSILNVQLGIHDDVESSSCFHLLLNLWVIPPLVLTIFLPVPCKVFSSIILKSSHKAYLSVRYSPRSKSWSCKCFCTSLALLSLCFPLAKYLQVLSYCLNNCIL